MCSLFLTLWFGSCCWGGLSSAQWLATNLRSALSHTPVTATTEIQRAQNSNGKQKGPEPEGTSAAPDTRMLRLTPSGRRQQPHKLMFSTQSRTTFWAPFCQGSPGLAH